ncbi:MAG TPA: hypothetical protein VLG17_20140 [Pseudomonas sp.]|uniref:hypothetical protein n=1 Tax=Pseudomonas sp. TaxID=306 RepID=UPI002C46D2F5|nr:hypothetical protein [Pseudomonas sp.]HSX90295.1 hypothetical protein [Pseudomonas sp.]
MNRNSGMSIVLATMLGVTPAFADEPTTTSTIRDSAKATVSTAIEAGKNLLGGFSEGVTEGRESAEGADGAASVSDLSQLDGKVIVELLRAEPEGDNLIATIGLKNSSDKQLRLINLRQTGALIAIDQDGYSSPLVASLDNPDQVTIPANAGVRQKFIFAGPVENVASVRLWGRDFTVAK